MAVDLYPRTRIVSIIAGHLVAQYDDIDDCPMQQCYEEARRCMDEVLSAINRWQTEAGYQIVPPINKGVIGV